MSMTKVGRAAMTDVLSAVAGELVLAQTTCERLDGALGSGPINWIPGAAEQ